MSDLERQLVTGPDAVFAAGVHVWPDVETTEARCEGSRAYRLVKAALAPALRVAFQVEAEGAGAVPASGPVILAANHRSFMDSVFLAGATDRAVSFLAKAEYFENRVMARVLTALGQIPLRRGSPAGARQAMEAARLILRLGGALGVYPEGTRSRDGLLHEGKLGPVRLAAAAGAPIVPVGLVGTQAVQAPGRRLPRVGAAVKVRFGQPLYVDVELAHDRHGLRQATDQVMRAIAGLCGQIYLPRA